MTEQLKHKTSRGLLWNLAENLLQQVLAFAIGVVLARLLSPSVYGTVGAISIFLALANVFVDCGFGQAIIRKTDRNQVDLSTAFYFNLVVAFITYGILFSIAPAVAIFFNMPILSVLLRVMGIMVIFNALNLVQNSLLVATLQLRTIAIVNISSQFIMGAVGIYLAYCGYGVWTLVAQQVGASILKTIILWNIAKWHPSFVFSRDSFRYLIDFGWKLLGANIIGTFFMQINNFIIGKWMGASELGLFSKSDGLCRIPNNVLNNVVNRLALPVLVEFENNRERTISTVKALVELLSFVTFGLMFLLASIANPLVILLWTDKWSEAIVLVQILCAGISWFPLSSLYLSVMQLFKRTDLILKTEFIKKSVLLSLLIAGIPFGVIGIAIASSLYNICDAVINMHALRRILGYSLCNQLKDTIKYWIIAVVSCILSISIISYLDNLYLQLIVAFSSYVFIYMFLNFIFRFSGITQLYQYYRNLRK